MVQLVHMPSCVHTHVHTHVHTDVHTHTRSYLHTLICALIHTTLRATLGYGRDVDDATKLALETVSSAKGFGSKDISRHRNGRVGGGGDAPTISGMFVCVCACACACVCCVCEREDSIFYFCC